MKTLMWLIPALIVVAVIAWKAYKSYKKGLFSALLDLGSCIAGAALAFAITRLLLNPENTDLFGLGEKLLGVVPPEFIATSPRYEALIRALPTAVAALIIFSALFGLLRSVCASILHRLDHKFGWSEKWLCFHGHRFVAVGVGLVTALFLLVMHLVPVGGLSTFASTAVQLVDTVFDAKEYPVLSDTVHGLAESPAVRAVDALGSRKLFCELTTARRGNETFSVGEELLHLAESFTNVLPTLRSFTTDGLGNDPEAIRDLPDQLLSTPEMRELAAGLLVSSREELVSSDAVRILSDLLDVPTDRFNTYLDQLDTESIHGDVTTFCNMAAILAEEGHVPEKGQEFDDAVLEDAALKARVRAELEQNAKLAQIFTPEKAEEA